MDDSVFPERNLPVTCLGQATGAHLSLAAGVQKRAGVSRRGSPTLLPHIQDENYPRTLLSLGVPHPEEGGGLQSLLIAQHGGGEALGIQILYILNFNQFPYLWLLIVASIITKPQSFYGSDQ